jgi:hypothetical protein
LAISLKVSEIPCFCFVFMALPSVFLLLFLTFSFVMFYSILAVSWCRMMFLEWNFCFPFLEWRTCAMQHKNHGWSVLKFHIPWYITYYFTVNSWIGGVLNLLVKNSKP